MISKFNFGKAERALIKTSRFFIKVTLPKKKMFFPFFNLVLKNSSGIPLGIYFILFSSNPKSNK